MNYIAEVEIEILKEIEKTRGIKAIKIIEQTPLEYKRIVMLIALGSKNNLELKKMLRDLKEKKPEEIIIGQIEKIIERFRKYIPVGKVEKKSFGEVFTPFTLVNEMLDTLPIEVWSNPNLKWADLCNGMGNFMIIIIKRLMIGLREWEPNEARRYRHIVENMIYVAELQVKNMFLWMLSIDPKSKLNINIYRGDSLHSNFDKHMKEVWKVEKFDIMVSNPPYNDGSGNMGSAHTLWNKFVIKYETILEKDGYAVLVHPSGWRSIDGGFKEIQNLLTSKEIHYLEMHDANDGIITFGAQTTYDWYCLKNTKNNNFISKIKCIDNTIEKIDLSTLNFIPSRLFSKYNKIIANFNDDKVELLHNSSYHTQKNYISRERTTKNIYPAIYTIVKDGTIKLRWSEINSKGHFGIPKVIWTNGSATIPIVDADGNYLLTEFAYAIVDDINNLENIKNALMNKEFLKLMNFGDGEKNVIGHKYNHKIISTLKKDFWKEFIKK